MSISELPVSRSDCNWFSQSQVCLHCRVPCCCSVQGVPRELTCYSVMSKDAGSWSWFLTVSECLIGSVHVWFFTSLLHFWHSLIWLNTAVGDYHSANCHIVIASRGGLLLGFIWLKAWAWMPLVPTCLCRYQRLCKVWGPYSGALWAGAVPHPFL